MGAQLVGMVLSVWAPRVGDNAFRVLVRMAHVAHDFAHDGIEAGLYFGGWGPLADTLGPMRDGRAAEARKPDTAKDTVKDAVAELIRLGAIERVGRGQPGRNAAYRLRSNGVL